MATINWMSIHHSVLDDCLQDNQKVSYKFKKKMKIFICSYIKVTFEGCQVTLNGWIREMWSESTDGETCVHPSTCQQAELISALIRCKYSSIQLISGFREHPGRINQFSRPPASDINKAAPVKTDRSWNYWGKMDAIELGWVQNSDDWSSNTIFNLFYHMVDNS